MSDEETYTPSMTVFALQGEANQFKILVLI